MLSSTKEKVKRSCIIALLFGAILIAYPLTFCNNAVHAGSSDSQVMEKALYNSLYGCYLSGALKSPIDISGKSSFNIADYIDESSSTPYVMPTKVGNTMEPQSNTVTCKKLLVGEKMGMTDIMSQYGEKINSSDPTEFGYVASGSASSTSCVWLKYTYDPNPGGTSSTSTPTTNKVCFPVKTNQNGEQVVDINKADFGVSTESGSIQGGGLSISYVAHSNYIVIKTSGEYTGGSFFSPKQCSYWVSVGQNKYEGCYDIGYAAVKITDGMSISSIQSKLDAKAKDVKVYGYGISGGSLVSNISTETDGKATGSVWSQYTIPDAKNAFNKFAKNTIGKTYDSLAFNNDDYVLMYDKYIKMAGLKIRSTECSENKNEYTYAYPTDKGKKWCKIDEASVKTADDKYGKGFGGRSTSNARTLKNMSISEILADMKNLDFSSSDVSAPETVDPTDPSSGNGNNNSSSSDGSSSGDGQTVPRCYEEAKSLGWFLCPVLEVTGNGVQLMYTYVEANFLEVKSDMVEKTKPAWSKFRDAANILFAIAFVIVILAQLTGIGISNYNIKKILPRLIMVVVLVNLSFVLCQIIVDISNILGDSLKTTLGDLGDSLRMGEKVPYKGSEIAGGVLNTLGFTAAAGAGAVIAFETWQFWLPALLLVFIGAAIGIFFALLILGVRQAAVVVLIAISPLAVVCYALPNTKSLFDKWFKVFKAVIVVYPISGALMGGGEFASSLLMQADTANNGFISLIAMLMTIVPFFFIPTIVKKSLDGIGGLGSAISGFGNKLSRGLPGAIRRSEGWRNFQGGANRLNDRMRGAIDRGVMKLSDGRGGAVGKMIHDQAEKGHNRRGIRYNRYVEAQGQIPRGSTVEFATPGSDARNKLEEAALERSQKAAVEGEQRGIMNGTATSMFDNHDNLSVNDVAGLGKEYSQVIDKLNDNTISSNERNKLIARRDALQNVLAKNGEGQNQLMDSIGDMVTSSNFSNAEGSSTRDAMNKFMNTEAYSMIKKKNPGLANAIKDIATGKITGPMSRDDFINNYALGGTNKLSDADLAHTDDEYLESTYNNLKATGNTSALKEFGSLSGEALGNSNLAIEGRNKKWLSRMATMAGASGAVRDVNDEKYYSDKATDGSSTLASMNGRAIGEMVRNIESNGQDAYINTETNQLTDAGEELRDLAENARRTIRTEDNLTADQISHLQSICDTADRFGITGYDSKKFGTVTPTKYNIRQMSPAARYESEYRSGTAASVVTEGATVNVNDRNSLSDEYSAILSSYLSNSRDPEIAAQLGGLQTFMQSTTLGQQVMESVLTERAANASAGEQSILQAAIQDFASGDSFSTLQRDNLSLSSLIADIHNGNFGAVKNTYSDFIKAQSSGAAPSSAYSTRIVSELSPSRIMNMDQAKRTNLINEMPSIIQANSSAAASLATAVADTYRTQAANLTGQIRDDLQTMSFQSITGGATGNALSQAISTLTSDPDIVRSMVQHVQKGNSADAAMFQEAAKNLTAAAAKSGVSGTMKDNIKLIVDAINDQFPTS